MYRKGVTLRDAGLPPLCDIVTAAKLPDSYAATDLMEKRFRSHLPTVRSRGSGGNRY